MDYEHDVFISYKREQNWTPWVNEFRLYLSSYLQQEMGIQPRIFIDERIEGGSDWVDELGHNLASSKIVVPLFSRDYFGSEWCIHELDLILERANEVASKSDKLRLIVPAIVHDGDAIPKEVQRKQARDFKMGRVIGLCRGTPRFEQFSVALSAFAPDVCKAIHAAPPFDPQWVEHHKTRFNEVYKASLEGHTVEPKQFSLVRPGAPSTPPRPSPTLITP